MKAFIKYSSQKETREEDINTIDDLNELMIKEGTPLIIKNYGNKFGFDLTIEVYDCYRE